MPKTRRTSRKTRKTRCGPLAADVESTLAPLLWIIIGIFGLGVIIGAGAVGVTWWLLP